MQTRQLDTIGQTLAWLAALSAAALAIAGLWLARHQSIQMDLAMMHYCAYLINEKGLLLYRDIFENNLPGPFFFHALIGKLFGYSAAPVRVLDTIIIILLSWLCWQLLQPLSRSSAVLAPALFTSLYFAGAPVDTFQRDYIAIVPITLALLLLCRPQLQPLRDAVAIGALCGIACSFKPNFIVVAPALAWLLLRQMPGTFTGNAIKLALPLAAGFCTFFAIPFIWALRHADLTELVTIYKTYTPIYVSTRPGLSHYDNRWQHMHDLLSLQTQHLGRMALASIPGLLWAMRQSRDNPAALQRVYHLAVMTFAIAWHEVIAGKYWFAHLLPPYFFATLCFSLLLMPTHSNAGMAEKILRIVGILLVSSVVLLVGKLAVNQLYNPLEDTVNYKSRAEKIASYLQQNLRPGDKVQALDGSGDGQGSLLLAGATTATRFVEDIPLYLQPNAPATQAFRHEFLSELQENPPAFFVYIENFFHPAGGNRLHEFTELDHFIQQNYVEADKEEGEYIIFRLKPAAQVDSR